MMTIQFKFKDKILSENEFGEIIDEYEMRKLIKFTCTKRFSESAVIFLLELLRKIVEYANSSDNFIEKVTKPGTELQKFMKQEGKRSIDKRWTSSFTLSNFRRRLPNKRDEDVKFFIGSVEYLFSEIIVLACEESDKKIISPEMIEKSLAKDQEINI